MLEAISWSQYLQTLGLALILYYACILWIYYRGPLRKHLSKQSGLASAGEPRIDIPDNQDIQDQKESRASSPTLDSKPK